MDFMEFLKTIVDIIRFIILIGGCLLFIEWVNNTKTVNIFNKKTNKSKTKNSNSRNRNDIISGYTGDNPLFTNSFVNMGPLSQNRHFPVNHSNSPCSPRTYEPFYKSLQHSPNTDFSSINSGAGKGLPYITSPENDLNRFKRHNRPITKSSRDDDIPNYDE